MDLKNVICHDIWDTIWDFAWGFRTKQHPLDDLDRMADIQRSIPDVLLKDRVAPLGWVDSVFPHCRTLMYQIFPRNPFKAGAPYIPFELVDSNIWSRMPEFILETILPSGINALVTYRGCLTRRLRRHYSRPVLQWNKSLEELFLPLSDLEPCHWKEDSWKTQFTSLVLEGLQGAQWLSTALP